VIATFVALVLRAFQGDAAPALLLASVPWSIDASPRTPALSFSICSDCVTRTMTILRRGDVGERVLRFRRDESTVPPFPVRRQLYAAVIAVTRDVARVMQSRRDTYRSQAPPRRSSPAPLCDRSEDRERGSGDFSCASDPFFRHNLPVFSVESLPQTAADAGA
jgi:hypothetical protein